MQRNTNIMTHRITTFRQPLIWALAFGTLLSACKKEEEAPPSSPGGGSSSATPSTTPTYTDADAVLAAVRVNTTQSTPIGPIDIILGTASASFSVDDFASFVQVGNVTCNSEALTPQSNNSYVHIPSATNPTGIDLTSSNEVVWTVAGGGGFAAFSRTVMGPFPTAGAISSSETVVRANGYTLTAGSVLNADSVVFTLGTLVRTLPGNASSCTFTASELSALGAGASLAQVVPYRATSEVIDGRNIYFVKQASRSKSVTIQ